MNNVSRIGILNAIKTQREIIGVLIEDLNLLDKHIQDNHFNFWLRSYIRSYFALVEGISYSLKQISLSAHKEEPCFTNAEVSLLNEVTYEINDKGDAQIKPKYLDTLSNIKLSFNSIIKAFELIIIIDYGDHGWYAFQQLLKIRNQITHPKDIKSLNIIEKEDEKIIIIETIIETSHWYTSQIQNIIIQLEKVISNNIIIDKND